MIILYRVKRPINRTGSGDFNKIFHQLAFGIVKRKVLCYNKLKTITEMQMDTNNKSVSIIIPVYNRQSVIENVLTLYYPKAMKTLR